MAYGSKFSCGTGLGDKILALLFLAQVLEVMLKVGVDV